MQSQPHPVSRVVPTAPSRPSQVPSAEIAWELFHENSKTSRLEGMLPDDAVVARMQSLQESLCYRGYPRYELPRRTSLNGIGLQDTLDRRESGRQLTACVISIDDLSTLLHYMYGRREHQPAGDFPRVFRTVPSGGALYPLEIYLHATAVLGLPVGLFHYEPPEHCLRLTRQDPEGAFRSGLVFPAPVEAAAVTIFITAVFYRATFKYGDRGYRFVLLEAGHVGQNLALTATALGLSAVNIGGYRDEIIDGYLGLDGLRQSAVYLAAVGAPEKIEDA
jgi:SagB-type dehydrogenase family enzyme